MDTFPILSQKKRILCRVIAKIILSRSPTFIVSSVSVGMFVWKLSVCRCYVQKQGSLQHQLEFVLCPWVLNHQKSAADSQAEKWLWAVFSIHCLWVYVSWSAVVLACFLSSVTQPAQTAELHSECAYFKVALSKIVNSHDPLQTGAVHWEFRYFRWWQFN